MCHVLISEDEWLIAESLAYLAEQAGATSIATACAEEEAAEAAWGVSSSPRAASQSMQNNPAVSRPIATSGSHPPLVDAFPRGEEL